MAYTPPNYNAVDFDLEGNYSAPNYDAVDFTFNAAPSISNPSPSDGATGVQANTSLSVDVFDPDGDSMDVSFYWDDGTLIETITDVADGGTATTSNLNLDNDTSYS